MRLFVCGDIMPGGILPYQEKYIDETLKNEMIQYDFRIGTLESAIGEGYEFDEVKMKGRANIIYARNEDMIRLKEMGFDVVSLANNHICDLGDGGLENTIAQLKQLGIQYCGAGMNIEEASRPAVVSKDGITVAFLAYCIYDSPWLGYVKMAGENTPGVCPLEITKVIDDIRQAKSKYDKVVVLPHWGKEYSYVPLPETIEMTRQMIAAGADAVMASHPHIIQPLVVKEGVPVCYSMGNFLFPDFYMVPPRPVWYPNRSEDLSHIPEVESYIFPVERHVLRRWEPFSRYGRAVELTIEGSKITAKSIITHLSLDNIVSHGVLEFGMRYHLWKESFKINSNLFKTMLMGLRKAKKKLVSK